MQINTFNLTLSPSVQSIIEEEHMYLYRFNIYILMLQCDIEKLEGIGEAYQVSLTLYLKERTYVIVSKDHNLKNALDEAFLSLQGKMMRLKARAERKSVREKLTRFLIGLPLKPSAFFATTSKPQLKG